ncbi:MAG TPA: urease accessory protein UreD [Jatrophihabitans sp.]
MITRSVAVVGRGGQLRHLFSRPPLTIRRVSAENPEACALCLVGSAAGPLSGDQITFDLTVEAGAHVELSSAGASIAQGRRHAGASTAPPGRIISHVSVGEHATLNAQPAPLIVSSGSRTEVITCLELAGSATLRWRELLVLGRSGQTANGLMMTWSVYRDGQPLLAQSMDLPADEARSWPGMLAGARVIATALLASPDLDARTIVHNATSVCQRLDEHAVLITVLDQDAESARTRLEALCAEAEPTLYRS